MNKNSFPNIHGRPSERGQNLVIIAIAMLALVGMLALVLDGGFSYAARRQAQNAADAGALAGANILCGIQEGNAYNTAYEYAVTRNDAVDAVIHVGSTVQVTAIVTHDSFLAGIIGQDVITATAYAEAGCYNPCGAAVLPVAWACAPPAGTTLEDDCFIETGTLTDPGPLYIVMDSERAEVDYTCQYPPNSGTPSGTLDCDIDNDGIDDLIGGGGRSWLNLSGGSGDAADLIQMLDNREVVLIDIHTWLNGAVATTTSIFRAVEPYVGEIVIVPVFNDFTDGCNPNTNLDENDDPCDPLDQWHEGLDTIRTSSGDVESYYHIISFSPYLITGVSTGNNACVSMYADVAEQCKAKEWLVTLGWLDQNAKTIEGYFIEGYEEGMTGKCSNYGGAVTIYLDH